VTNREALAEALPTIARVSDTALLDAEILLAHDYRVSRERIIIDGENECPRAIYSRFRSMVKKRLRKTPIAYITGVKHFFENEFSVTNDVLIPRPETELVVERAIEHLKAKRAPTIVDVGTGSGCIAVSLAKALPNARVIATDASSSALLVAEKNAREHGVAGRIRFYRTNLLESVRPKKATFVLANLPYLNRKEAKAVEKTHKEPFSALFGGRNGLTLYQKLFQQLTAWNIKGVLVEIDPQQVPRACALASVLKPKKFILHKDLDGKHRTLELAF
jgi:release factor glutamine methyltransferase